MRRRPVTAAWSAPVVGRGRIVDGKLVSSRAVRCGGGALEADDQRRQLIRELARVLERYADALRIALGSAQASRDLVLDEPPERHADRRRPQLRAERGPGLGTDLHPSHAVGQLAPLRSLKFRAASCKATLAHVYGYTMHR